MHIKLQMLSMAYSTFITKLLSSIQPDHGLNMAMPDKAMVDPTANRWSPLHQQEFGQGFQLIYLESTCQVPTLLNKSQV